MNKRTLLILALVFTLSLIVVGCTSNDDNDAVATVDGEEITSQEFDEAFNQMLAAQGIEPESSESDDLLEQYQQDIVDHLVGEKVLQLEMEKEGIEVTEEEVQAEIEIFKQEIGGQEEFDQILEREELTENELADIFREGMKSDKFMEENTDVISAEDIEITEEELEEYTAFMKEQYEQMGQPMDEEQLEEMKPMIEQQMIQEQVQAAQAEQRQALVEQIKENYEIEILI